MNEERKWKRREILEFFKGAGLTTVLSGVNILSCNKKKKSPNILLIVSDDQGINDVSAYGSEIPTPNIDNIGQNGIQFTNFYVTAPVCTPSRYGLLTGKYQYRAAEAFGGALLPKDAKHSDVHLPDDELTIADVMKMNGYKTGLIGKWHLGHGSPEYGPNNYGFDYFYGFLPGCMDFYEHTYDNEPALYRNKNLIKEKGYATDLFTDEAVRFIEKYKNDPFFLFLSYNAPHYGRCPDGKFLQSPSEAADLPEKSIKDRAVYAAMVKNLDRGIGKVMESLKKLKLEEDTIIIFFSDNGGDYDFGGSNKPYRGEKGTLWEGGIRVPCMIQWKTHINSGQISEQVLVSLDIFPTLVRFTGASLPSNKNLDGYNIENVLLQNESAPDRYLFFKLNKQIAVRSSRWKYFKDSDNTEYLFDMMTDPCEKQNIINDNQPQTQILRSKFEKFIQTL